MLVGVKPSGGIERFAPVATGAATGLVSLWANVPAGFPIGAAAISATASIFAATIGQNGIALHLGSAALGILAGTGLRVATSPAALESGTTRSGGFLWVGKLRNEAYSSLPHSALVYAPPGFDPSRPFAVFVYFRGWGSCVTVLAGAEPARCSPGGRSKTPSDLMGQVDRSGANVLLVMPEWPIERDSSDPGALAREGAFRAMLDEVMVDVLSPAFGRPVRLDSASKIVLAAHSGGYRPLADALSRGGLPRRDDVLLLDAFYAGDAAFLSHVRQDGRLATLYTSGATERHSRSLADALRVPVLTAGFPLTEAQWRQPVIVARTTIDHSRLPLGTVQSWLQTRDLPPR
jgi:hypothetical protein